tara:strand:+ start:79 stop:654 length:576 start_codon:yes stop_codon:yes gene_type:complete
MKTTIAITGTTRGIGKATADRLEKEGNNIISLNRNNGFDLSLPWEQVRHKLWPVINYADIFINNVHQGFTQVQILQHLFQNWKNQNNKTIINISSTGGDRKADAKGIWANYQLQKIALDEACKQLEGMGKCKVVNVRPGWVNTDGIEGIQRPIGINILQPSKIAQTISYIINQPAEVHIKNISIEPWYKKK